jgi:transcriptional/translational regulatory protein YebC/TACO1
MPGDSSRWANLQRRQSARARKRQHQQARNARAGLEAVNYEGYGPGGAAVMVECLTDDRTGTGAAVRRVFEQHGGQIGAAGSVSYLFNPVGLMSYPPGTDQRQLLPVALAAGAEDVVANPDTSVEVLADPLDLAAVRAALTESGFAPASAEITQRAATSLALSGEVAAEMARLLEALEGIEAVRDVYANVEISDEALART